MSRRKKIADIKFDGMLAATFLTTIFYSATYPYIHREIMRAASSSVIALVQIMNGLSVVLFGWLWNRKSDTLFRFYPIYCVMETLLGVCTTAYAITTGNIVPYYLIDCAFFALITRNIICGGVKLRAIRYATEAAREHFDNNNNSAAAVATIIGSLIAMRLDLNFPAMLCVATFGNAIDNAFYIGIYLSSRKKWNRDAPET